MKTCSEAEQVQTKKQKDLAVLNAKNKGGDISKIVSSYVNAFSFQKRDFL